MSSTVLSPASPPAAFYAPAHRQPAASSRPATKPPAPHRLQQRPYHPPSTDRAQAQPPPSQASKPPGQALPPLPAPEKEVQMVADKQLLQQRSEGRFEPAAPPPPATETTAGLLTKDEEMRRRQLVKDFEGLSGLCSQHHRSEYNRLKWGPAGAPIYYVPLTIQLPDHVRQTMEHQAAFEAKVAEASSAVHAGAPCAADPSLTSPSCPTSCDTSPTASSIATLSSAESVMPAKANQTQAELEHHIAVAALEPASGRALAEEEGLHGIAVGKTDPVHASSQPVEPEPTTEDGAARVDERLPRPGSTAEQSEGSGVEQRIREAIAEPILPPPSSPSASMSSSASSVAAGEVFSSIEAGRQRSPGPSAGLHVADSAQLILPSAQSGGLSPGAMKTSDTHPINISILIPPSALGKLTPLLSHPVPPPSAALDLPCLLSLPRLAQSAPATDVFVPENERTGRQVGNFLMSSCPGKKVRLGGPVKGRGAICRDLEADLRRIKSLGVGAMICCLDDSELLYLGSPIALYASLCAKLGLELVRIPMPEGLTPVSLDRFDQAIEHIVRDYTLKGVSVLAHCRGGVGRAGLVACAWALKMGLVPETGEVPPFAMAASASYLVSAAHPDDEDDEEERFLFGKEHDAYARADLQITRDVIAVIRRRRSVKAIETYEQVRWVVNYVRRLREARESPAALTNEAESAQSSKTQPNGILASP